MKYALGAIGIIILIFFYLKWKHPFWFIQPVYHYYDIFFWGRQREIRRELPSKNKFFNPQIQFCKTETLDSEWGKFHLFVKNNFLKNGSNIFSPTLNEIKPYFIGFNNPCYISFLYKNTFTNTSETKELIGTITSRPLSFSKKIIYYVDYLCIDESERKKRLTPQLIQTHEYHQSHDSKSQISFFRREGPVPLLVPFVKFNCTLFSMEYWKETKTRHKVIRVTSNNIHTFNDFFQTINYDFFIKNDIGNILELVKTENIIIYMCIKEKIEGCYFFRKTCTTIEGKGLLTLYASFKTNADTFVDLFKASLSVLMKTEKAHYLCVEELGDNILISNNLAIKTHPYEKIECGYYFYNYIHRTINAKKCCVLN